MNKKYPDIKIGDTFGRLTVIGKPIEEKINAKSKWECQCCCKDKNIVYVCAYNLNNGNTKSCGCIQKEKSYIAREAHKKTNKYKEFDDYYVGFTDNVNSFGENFFIIDKDDYKKIKDRRWYFEKSDYLRNGKSAKEKILMHKLILDLNNENVIDHKNHHKNDNRKQNLFNSDKYHNARNIKPTRKSKTGITGVSIKGKKYRATLRFNGDLVLNKTFDTIEEAIVARRNAELEYFGEAAYENIIKTAPIYPTNLGDKINGE